MRFGLAHTPDAIIEPMRCNGAEDLQDNDRHGYTPRGVSKAFLTALLLNASHV